MTQVSNFRNDIHTKQAADQIRQLAASATLNVYDLVTHVSDAAAAVVVTLPPVAEAAGKMYAIYTVDSSGGNGVDVISQGDELYAVTEVSTTITISGATAIDTAGDFLLMYSTGVCWICLAFNTQ